MELLDLFLTPAELQLLLLGHEAAADFVGSFVCHRRERVLEGAFLPRVLDDLYLSQTHGKPVSELLVLEEQDLRVGSA